MALQVEVGIAHSCALVNDAGTKKVYCWGDNRLGQLGTNRTDIQYSFTPQSVNVGSNGLPASERVVSLSAGANRAVQLCRTSALTVGD